MSAIAGGNAPANMVSTICCSCREDIESDETCYECDGCIKTFHISCDRVKKTDVSHRKNSERLKLYCAECCKSTQMANIENIKTILRFIYKIDAQMQQQSMVQTDVASQLEALKSECVQLRGAVGDINKSLVNVSGPDDVTRKKTFSSVVRAASQPPVIIKPKNVLQTTKKTIDDIRSHIDYKQMDVADVRSVRGGGIAVTCESGASTLNMKNVISNKFGDKYDVKLPKILKPRVKIVNALNDVPDDQIVNELKRQNEWFADTDEIEVKKIVDRKKATMAMLILF